MCSKYEKNVCSATNWLAELQSSKCPFYALDELGDCNRGNKKNTYIELDKFMVCTDDASQEFVRNTEVRTVVDVHCLKFRLNVINNYLFILRLNPHIFYLVIA
jgi:hypothetical protein